VTCIEINRYFCLFLVQDKIGRLKLVLLDAKAEAKIMGKVVGDVLKYWTFLGSLVQGKCLCKSALFYVQDTS
jgi:hypothetical protein